MALNTTRRRTSAALGTDADDTDAAVEVKLEREKRREETLTLIYTDKWRKFFFYSHNSYDFTESQGDPVHLGDEYARHGHEQHVGRLLRRSRGRAVVEKGIDGAGRGSLSSMNRFDR